MKNKFKILRILAVAAVLLVVVASSSLKQIKSAPSKGDIDIYLNASRMALQGENIYETPNRNGSDFYVYPPLLALSLAPLLPLPIEITIIFWCVLNIFLVFWMLRTLYDLLSGERFSALPEKSRWVLIFFPVLLDLRFILHHLSYGQANILSYSLVILGLRLLTKNRPTGGGFIIGISMVTKLLTLPFGIWFLARKNFKACLGIALGLASGLLAPVLVLGWQKNLFYLDFWLKNIILDDNRRNLYWALGINFSLQAQITRFFTETVAFDFRGSPYNLTIVALSLETVKVFGFLIMFLVAVALAFYAWKYRKSSALVSQWGGVALTFSLIPIFSPVALQHHFVALLPAYFFAVYVWHCRRLKDHLFRGLVIASFALTSLTSEIIWGKDLKNVFLAVGCLSLGTLALSAAIFRAADCLANAEQK